MRTHLVRPAALSAILLLLSGCRLPSDGDCGYDQRWVIARGVAEGGLHVAHVDVNASDVRGSINQKHVGWHVSARELDGHITRITLVNQAQGVPIFEIPLTAVGLPYVYLGHLTQESGAASPALEGIFEMIAANQTAIEITTDLPDRPLITVQAAVETNEDWTPSRDCY